VQLRCYLFNGGSQNEVIRWFLPPDGSGWAQQVGKLEGDAYHDTSWDGNALLSEGMIATLVAEGKAVPL